MSAVIRLMTPMIDEECLVEALNDRTLADTPAVVRQGGIRVAFSGISASFVPGALGYTLEIEGEYRRDVATAWLGRVNERYAMLFAEKQARLAAEDLAKLKEAQAKLRAEQESRVIEKAKSMGYRLDKRTEADGTVRLVLMRKMS